MAAQYAFGSGACFATQLTDAFGVTVALPTPVQFGALQDISIDVQGDIKELFGQNAFPLAVARGKTKISAKAKLARINGATLNALFFGQGNPALGYAMVYDTTGAAIPTTPFQITPTVPNSGTWAFDLGVISASTGRAMARVASGPATGQYAVTAGVYTFAAADTGLTVYINYQYTFASTVARKQIVTNVQMGFAPTFRVDLQESFNGNSFGWTLNSCVGTKLMIATKLDDFWMPEFDFSAFADTTGNVMTLGVAE